MIHVLIAAPSLDARRNVSGVSSVVKQIIGTLTGSVKFAHLQIGKEQQGSRITRSFSSLLRTGRAFGILLFKHYDVFHSNTALNRNSIIRDVALTAIAALRKKNVVLHLHGGTFIQEYPSFFLRCLVMQMFFQADTIVVLSNTERAHLVELYPQYASKFRVIYNGVGITKSDERTYRNSGILRVGFIGRLVEEKGVRILIEAMSSFDDADPISFTIFGDGKLRTLVEGVAATKINVNFGGVFAAAEINSILAKLDLLVLPSLNGEGMPMVVVEAMAAGVAPLCTPISSIPEIIKEGVTGFLITRGSVAALTQKLRDLSSNSIDIALVGRNCKKFAMEHFNASQNYLALLDVYSNKPIG